MMVVREQTRVLEKVVMEWDRMLGQVELVLVVMQ